MTDIDKELEKHGYKLLVDKNNTISFYNYKEDYEILFDKKYKKVYFEHDIGEEIFGNRLFGVLNIEFEVIKLIYQKCIELGFDSKEMKNE